MIPGILLIGFAIGFFLRRYVSVRVAVLVGLVLAAAWGIGVGVSDASMTTAIGGFGLAGLNLVVGEFVGRLVRSGRGSAGSVPKA